MGWNHWYTHYHRITDKLMREAADVMISSGMADVGYQYVNIDDCWMMKPGSDDPNLQRTGARRLGHHPPQQAFPGHEGPHRLHPRQGPQGRHLHLARDR